MILQSLLELYQRRMNDPDPAQRLPAYGFEEKPLPYLIVIDQSGALVTVKCTLSDDKKPVAQSYLVPQGVKKTSGVAANLLWDSVEYALGIDTRGKPERVQEMHAAFRARIHALSADAQADPGLQALQSFLDRLPQEGRAAIQQSQYWPAMLEGNPNLSFQLNTDPGLLICQRPAVQAACLPKEEDAAEGATETGLCLVTGQEQEIQELHTAIKGVWGAQTAGANIVSFNAPAYCSYGNSGRQGWNAPTGKLAAFGYTTALNDLLKSGSRQRLQIGDASTVFWTEKSEGDAMAQDLADIFGDDPKDEPGRGAAAVKKVYTWVHSGKAATLEGDGRFYVLGLGPNAARIAIRFWHCLSLREMAENTAQHFDDLEISIPEFEKNRHLPMNRLFGACVAQKKKENFPANLAPAVMHAALHKQAYPLTFYRAALLRCSIERQVTWVRAAIIKACLLRQWRENNSQSFAKDYLVSLNSNLPEQQKPAYSLGRLFAVYEKIQKDAVDPNSGIRERWFATAMHTPVRAFPNLEALSVFHLAKLRKQSKSYGNFVTYGNLIDEIMGDIPDGFPDKLDLEKQGLFCVGYHHQRQMLYKSKSKEAATDVAVTA
ncbi:type I-C CRISPR-associated protein Cas8c/Csd1 [Massilia sp. W12]|uniref:type I-C CRISPR-associated protein Cas8c/Csd1 n=1 Tax=Massilia sp. W12 TaxID=3126507 RepID=UPI0030CC1A0F